jgi:DNA ligase-1
MNFSEITKALAEISSISSGNEKLAWLKAHNDNDLKEIFKWYFDNSYPTGISEKKYSKGSSNGMHGAEVTFHHVMEYLKIHNTGRDGDITNIFMMKDFLCHTPEEEECFKKLVCKNYPMGIDAKTINKVFKNLVPTFDVCLCDKYYDKPERVDGCREIAISPKIDGCRVIAIKENGAVRLISRQGKPWTGLVEVENDIKNLVADNFVLDGELTIDNFMKYPSKEVYKMTTKIVSTKDEAKKGITLNAFDMMSLANWNEKNCSLTYDERQTLLKNTLKATDHPHISYVEDVYTGYDVSKIEELMKGVVRTEDWEGLVIKFTDSLYEWKRSKNWLKVKAFDEMDLIIKGYEEGSNSLAGKLGALICEIEHPTLDHIEAKVGSGYSEDERERFWSTKDELIGRTISVQYFEQTENTTTGVKSLRFPVFLELKEAGQEPNN